jgi:hypothetical protein
MLMEHPAPKSQKLLTLSNQIQAILENARSLPCMVISGELYDAKLSGTFRDYWNATQSLLGQAQALTDEFSTVFMQLDAEVSAIAAIESTLVKGELDLPRMTDQQLDSMDLLTYHMAGAKALAVISSSFDFSEVVPSVVENYFGAMQQLLELAISDLQLLRGAFRLQ